MLVVALLAVALSGCSSSGTPASGVGDARVALYANSIYGFDDDVHGHVLLVSEDGSVGVVKTDGLYFGSLGLLHGALVASDQHHEVVITKADVKRLDRPDDYDMEWWSGTTARDRWTMFNVGTRGTGTYYTGVTATDGHALSHGEIRGEVLGNRVCGGKVVAAVGRWKEPRNPQGTTLRVVTKRGTGIRQSTLERLRLPAESIVTNLACFRRRVVVLAMRDNTTLVGQLTPNGDRHWAALPRSSSFSGDSSLLGVRHSEVLTSDPYEGVQALDLEDLSSRQVMGSPAEDGLAEVSLDGDALVAWIPAARSDGRPYLRWFDPRDGSILREIPGGEVSDVLQDHDEVVDHGPVVIR